MRPRVVALVESVIGGRRRIAHTFGVGQHTLLRFQVRIFLRLKSCVGDLFALVVPQVEQLQAVGFIALQFGDTAADLVPLLECGGGVRVVSTGKTVKEIEARRWIEAEHRLILCVDNGEIRSKLFQDGYSRCLIINEDAPFAACADLPAEDDLAILGVDTVLFKHSADCFRANLEHS